ncbi:hypothetical protein [Metabacillus sp. Hm71]|uniref:hypothetical protein n=1 Tax=Metabacillus sp. Hm71 TaxID=3450743 RepID=UPI003F41BFF4
MNKIPTQKEYEAIRLYVHEVLGVDPNERTFDTYDVMNYIAIMQDKVKKYEEAIESNKICQKCNSEIRNILK